MAKNFYTNRLVPASSRRTIELTVMSAEDLRMSRRLISRNAFVTIRHDNDIYDRAVTEMDTDGGSYPRWSQKFVLELPVGSPALTLEVYCRSSFGTKLVGRASVPVSDFSGGYVPESYLHFLSYRLRDSRGERNGIINVSVRTKLPAGVPPEGSSTDYKCSGSGPVRETTMVGVPVTGIKSCGRDNFGGVVTGVPIWSTY